MKKIVIKLFEPALFFLLFFGIVSSILLNYFNYLQFAGMNFMNLLVGSMVMLLQVSALLAIAGLLSLCAEALRKYLADEEEL
ncbi:MAG: hypothetical protein K9K75_02175 [Deltaproteobacteria bacterium]|nr:hypothetical protein [Deltaproteobacteria bacterium]